MEWFRWVAGLSDSSICVWDDHRTNRKFLGLSRIYFLCWKITGRASAGSTFLYACRLPVYTVCFRCFASVGNGQLFKCTIECRLYLVSFLEYYPISERLACGRWTEIICYGCYYHSGSRFCGSFSLYFQWYILV